MTYNRRKVGSYYEQRAGQYLEEQGYTVVAYNYRCPQGEIDIIARDGDYLVFCEVKYRRGRRSSLASEAVDTRKQRILSRCALWYTAECRLTEEPCRFDVVGITDQDMTLIQNAFDYTE